MKTLEPRYRLNERFHRMRRGRDLLGVCLLLWAGPVSGQVAPEAPAPLPTAGHDGRFFIQSSDGQHRLELWGRSQTRYVFATAQRPPGLDPTVSGIQQRRTQLWFTGHTFGPSITYEVKLDVSAGTGRVGLHDALLRYAFSPGVSIRAGQFKIPFMREFQVGATNLQAVERSYVHGVFSAGRSQGVELALHNDPLAASVMLHDGSRAENTDFDTDAVALGVAGRVTWVPVGTQQQFLDYQSWSTDATGLLIGAAIDQEFGERGAGTSTADLLRFTAELALETGGFDLSGEFTGQQVRSNGSALFPDVFQWGVVSRAGIFLISDKLDAFVRHEFLSLDGVYFETTSRPFPSAAPFVSIADDTIQFITVGTSVYLHRNRVKLSQDVVWAADPVPSTQAGSGLILSSEPGEISARTQLSLMF